MSSRYLLVSPCRDEVAFARRTLDSVTRQSAPPSLWIIVDDGSTDGTLEILEEYAARYEYIRVIRRGDRGARSVGPGVVDAFYEGLEAADLSDFDFVCKLDMDLELPLRYFETLMHRMSENPRIGTCSGKPYYVADDGSLVDEKVGDDMSAGMTKFYRRECFEDVGGFVREVMWDGIDCHRARMLGWIARSWDSPELRFTHLRQMGSSQVGVFTGRKRHGRGQWFMGTGLGFMTASAAFRATRPPYILGGLGMLTGYLGAMLTRQPRYSEEGFRPYLRRYQRHALRAGKSRALARIEAEGASIWSERHAEPSRGWTFPEIDLLGIPLSCVSERQCVKYIGGELEAGRGGWVVTPNLDHLARLVNDEAIRELYSSASLCVADGMPLVWASNIQRTPLPERVAGSNLISSVSEQAASDGRSVFFLGGEPGTAERAAETLQERYPGLRVAGTLCPEIGFESDPKKMAAVRKTLCDARPDVVFVALGSPKQERFIDLLRVDLPSSWWLGIGISFSFVCGDIQRAPVWMQRVGMEWMHRLAQEPRRLARRYLLDGLPFALRLFSSSIVRRIRGAPKGRVLKPVAPPLAGRSMLVDPLPSRDLAARSVSSSSS